MLGAFARDSGYGGSVSPLRAGMSSHPSAGQNPLGLPPPGGPQAPALKSNVIVLTNATSGMLLSVVGNVYTYNKTATQVSSAKVGDVLVSTLPPGYLINITSIAVGSTIVVGTVPADLSNVYGPGSLGFAGKIALPSPPANNNQSLAPAAAQPASNWQLGLGNVFVGGTSSVTVSGSIGMSLSSDLALNFSWFSLQSAYFEATLSLTVTMGVSVSAGGTVGGQIPIGDPVTGDCVDVGVFCIAPQLSFNLGVKVSTLYAYSETVTYSWSESVGISCSGSSCTPFASNSQSATFTQNAQVSAQVLVYATAPKVTFLIDEIAGPFVSMVPGIQFVASPSSFALNLVLLVNAGIATNAILPWSFSAGWTVLDLTYPIWTTTWTNYESISTTVNGTTSPAASLSGTNVVVAASGGVSGDGLEIELASSPSITVASPCTFSGCTGTFSSSGTYSTSIAPTTGFYASTTYIGIFDASTGLVSNWVPLPILPTPHVVLQEETGAGIVQTSTTNNLTYDRIFGGGIQSDNAELLCSSSGTTYVATPVCGTYPGTFGENGTGVFAWTVFLQTGATATMFYIQARDTTRGLSGGWLKITILPSPSDPYLNVWNGTKNASWEFVPNGTSLTYDAFGVPGDSVKILFATNTTPYLSMLTGCSSCSGKIPSGGTFTASGPLSASFAEKLVYIVAEDTTTGEVGNWVPVYVTPTLTSYYLTVGSVGGTYPPKYGPTAVANNETFVIQANVPPALARGATESFAYVFAATTSYSPVSQLQSCSSSSPYQVASLPCDVTVSVSGGASMVGTSFEFTRTLTTVFVGLYYTNSTTNPLTHQSTSWSKWGSNWLVFSSTPGAYTVQIPALGVSYIGLPYTLYNNTRLTMTITGPANDFVQLAIANAPTPSASSLTYVETFQLRTAFGLPISEGEGHPMYGFTTGAKSVTVFLGVYDSTDRIWAAWFEFVVLPTP
jgi:hypothetical protein